MGNFIDSITSEPVHLPPRILIYAPPKTGKSTLGASASDVVVMDLEKGLPGRAVPRFTGINDYSTLIIAMKELATGEHKFRSLAIDSASTVQAMIHAEICDGANVENIGLIPFGRGYSAAAAYWEEIRKSLDVLREQRGMTIIMIAHSEIVEVRDPVTGPFSKLSPSIDKRALGPLLEWFDLIALLSMDRVVAHKGTGNSEIITSKVTGSRILITQDDGTAVAGCRWDIAPRIVIPKEDGFAVLKKELSDAMKATAEADIERAKSAPKIETPKTKKPKKGTEEEF